MGMNHTKCAYWATLDGRTKDLEWHIQNGANLCTSDSLTGRTLLHLASERGNITCVELILVNSKSKHINYLDHDENSPLNIAVFWNHFNTVNLLLRYGASPNITQTQRKLRFYRSPLHIAATKSTPDIVDKLLEAGSRVNIQDSWGYTPLMIAATSKSMPCVLRLLEAGANTEIIDYLNNATVLQIALNERFLEAIPILLHFGANPNTLTSRLQSPLMQAIDMNIDYIAVLLLEYSAKLPNNYILANHKNSELIRKLIKYNQTVRSLKCMCRTIIMKYFKADAEILAEYYGSKVTSYLMDDYACYLDYLRECDD